MAERCACARRRGHLRPELLAKAGPLLPGGGGAAYAAAQRELHEHREHRGVKEGEGEGGGKEERG